MPKRQTTGKTHRFAEASALRTHANAYLLDCEARNLSRGTIRFYWQRLALWLDFLESHNVSAPAQMTGTLIRSFLASYRERGLSPYYAHQAARVIKSWCFWLVREGVLDASPMRTVKMPKLPKDVLPPFTGSDVAALLNACDNLRDKALILVMLDSGVRASELLALNVEDVDLTTGQVTVRLGKGAKTRTTFIGSRTRRALVAYLTERGAAMNGTPLFLSKYSTRMTFYGLQSLLRRLAVRSDVHPTGAHRFRRTFAIEALRAGMPLPQLAAMMGHAGLAVLQRYLSLVTSDLADAHRDHGPVDSLLSKGGGR